MKFCKYCIILALPILGCSHTNVVDHSNMEPESPIRDAFQSLAPYATELVSELDLLARIRSEKVNSSLSDNDKLQRQLIYTGGPENFQKKITWSCGCEIETIMKGIAEKVGFPRNRVFVYGDKPPGGVFVNLVLDNEPAIHALAQIDASKGSQVDVSVSNKFKSVIIKYKEVHSFENTRP